MKSSNAGKPKPLGLLVLVPLFCLVLALVVSPSAFAATTDTITVTVSLQSSIEVTVNPNTINLGQIASLPATVGPSSATATVGNTTTQLDIKATDAVGGWTLAGSPGPDQFRVTVASPSLTLTTSDQVLDAGVVPYASKVFDLTYDSPTADSFGGGMDQSFSVTVTGSIP